MLVNAVNFALTTSYAAKLNHSLDAEACSEKAAVAQVGSVDVYRRKPVKDRRHLLVDILDLSDQLVVLSDESASIADTDACHLEDSSVDCAEVGGESHAVIFKLHKLFEKGFHLSSDLPRGLNDRFFEFRAPNALEFV